MRKLPALVTALLLSGAAFAQNLVPNPGFEVVNTCPNSIGAIVFDPAYTSFPSAQGWVSPLYEGSPDFFHTCATAGSGVHVPEAQFGYQYPHSGNGYAGIIAYDSIISPTGLDYREYLQCKLLQPLQSGKKYCVSFYVNNGVAASGPLAHYNFIGIDDLGINFSVSKPTESAPHIYKMHLPPTISNMAGNYITDTLGWKKISSTFTANGGEQWLTLGCFGNAINYTQLTTYPNSDFRCYLYVDDLSVVPISTADTVIHTIDSIACSKQGFSMKLFSAGDENILWSTGVTTGQVTIDKIGTYWCRSFNNCQVTIDTFHITFDPAKALSLGNDTGNCKGQSFAIQGNPGFSNYLWNTGDTGKTVMIDKSGTYILAAINECGLQRDTINVYIQPPTAPPVISDTVVCQYTPSPKLDIKGTALNWYTHPNGIFGFPEQPQITTSQPGTFTFYITQTIGKCESEKVPMNIKVRYMPQHELPESETMCEKYPDSIGVWHPDVNYKWGTGNFSCCIIPDHEGLYRVAMTNECGTYVDSTKVLFSSCDTCITIPNAFTPDRDGRNDIFKPIIMCPVETFHMRIIGRWGNVVYDSDNMEAGWNGWNKNIPCDQGVYVYVIEYRSGATKRQQMLHGNVTLIR